ncbi:MAG TPA: hypothetical protein PLI09_00620 [Candidatus Hydrogenedentes bacterium]|nr:hypothetical protein [Candidatus Hydrogenedentota bacterium]
MKFRNGRCLSGALFVFLLLLKFAPFSSAQESTTPDQAIKVKFGIMKFDVDEGLSPSLGTFLYNVLLSSMVESGKYTVVDWEEIDRILKYLATSQPNLSPDDARKQAISQLGIQKMCLGSLVKVGSQYHVAVKVLNLDLSVERAERATASSEDDLDKALKKIAKLLALTPEEVRKEEEKEKEEAKQAEEQKKQEEAKRKEEKQAAEAKKRVEEEAKRKAVEEEAGKKRAQEAEREKSAKADRERKAAQAKAEINAQEEKRRRVAQIPGVSVTIKKIWLEHNLVNNGQKGMKIHIAYEAKGLKKVRLSVNAYFFFENGEALKDFNNQYRTKDGFVCKYYNDIKPKYDYSTFDDTWMFMPHSEFHIKESNDTYKLKFYIIIWKDDSSEKLAVSDWIHFTYTNPP